MKSRFNLSIKKPCSEDFNKFSITTKGGFCDSCKKEVIDFTKMNSQEIIQYIEKKDSQKICGRFYAKQLNNYETKTYKRNFQSIISSVGFMIVSFFLSSKTQAQENNEIKQSLKDNHVNDSIKEKRILVKGTVVDEIGPLAGVNVIIQGTTFGTTTDFDGNFEFPEELKKGDVLIFSYTGLESKKIVIENANSVSKIELKVSMAPCEIIMMGKVAKKGVYSSKNK